MTDWIERGHFIDWILVLIVLEALLIGLLVKLHRVRLGLMTTGLNLLAGASLLLVMRSVVYEQPWYMILAWLTVALLAHSADVLMRARAAHEREQRMVSPRSKS